jgi:hypothetical protein
MNTETTPLSSIKLSRLLPKTSPKEPDQWEIKGYEVIDALPTWIWRDGAPVCIGCQVGKSRFGPSLTVTLTLRVDGETCVCKCDQRAMREIL